MSIADIYKEGDRVLVVGRVIRAGGDLVIRVQHADGDPDGGDGENITGEPERHYRLDLAATEWLEGRWIG